MVLFLTQKCTLTRGKSPTSRVITILSTLWDWSIQTRNLQIRIGWWRSFFFASKYTEMFSSKCLQVTYVRTHCFLIIAPVTLQISKVEDQTLCEVLV